MGDRLIGTLRTRGKSVTNAATIFASLELKHGLVSRGHKIVSRLVIDAGGPT